MLVLNYLVSELQLRYVTYVSAMIQFSRLTYVSKIDKALLYP